VIAPVFAQLARRIDGATPRETAKRENIPNFPRS